MHKNQVRALDIVKDHPGISISAAINKLRSAYPETSRGVRSTFKRMLANYPDRPAFLKRGPGRQGGKTTKGLHLTEYGAQFAEKHADDARLARNAKAGGEVAAESAPPERKGPPSRNDLSKDFTWNELEFRNSGGEYGTWEADLGGGFNIHIDRVGRLWTATLWFADDDKHMELLQAHGDRGSILNILARRVARILGPLLGMASTPDPEPEMPEQPGALEKAIESAKAVHKRITGARTLPSLADDRAEWMLLALELLSTKKD